MPDLEALGGALFGALLQLLVDKLDSPQLLHYFRGKKLDELLENLRSKLVSINTVIDDAEQNQFRSPYVKAWHDEVRDVLLDTEDLLDEIDYEFSKTDLKAEYQSSASKVSSFESKMKELLDQLESLLNQNIVQYFKISSGVGSGLANNVLWKTNESSSLVAQEIIYGRDEDKEIILYCLTSENNNHNQLSILSIVGIGGLGKTALAQHVYNDPMINAIFSIKVWVCVSGKFDVFLLTQRILESICMETDNSRNLEMVQGKLKEKLKGKKFLLVLDDVWNEHREHWKALQTPLKCGAKGSKILITTRSHTVAFIMESNNIHQLKQLQEDHSWQVFARHAFEDANSKSNSVLEEIGKKIVEKCQGLPLAIETVGGLLRSKSSVSEWEDVLSSNIWDLPINDRDVIPALLLSYYHLPSHLKRCFVYCALFPKDPIFDKEYLIFLWMSENFLQCSQQSKSPEEVGEQYFNDLLSRSFFQQSIGLFQNCFVMHDLLIDLAKYVSGEICYRLGVDRAKRVPNTTRHFSIVNYSFQCDEYRSLLKVKRLRTFLSRSGNYGMSIQELITNFKFLRVLSLSCCLNVKEVPDTIADLIHLRSLDLSSTLIKRLPDSICSLYNLQVLKLNNCRALKELPSTLHELTKLRHLELKGTTLRKAPILLGKLKNLQVWMGGLEVGKSSSEFNIQQLGELDLQPRHLEQLSIINYCGTQFPGWLSDKFLLNMLSLTLKDCKYCQRLPSSLGLLTFLKKLEIGGLDYIVSIDADFYGNNSSTFASLETLWFTNMKEWKEWQCMTGAFPRLQSLFLINCPKLKGHLPEHLPHLKELTIVECEQLVASTPRTVEIEGVNMETSSFDTLLSHTPLEYLGIRRCPGMNIPINHCYHFLVELIINECCCYSLTNFYLDLFPKLRNLILYGCHNLQMISQGHSQCHLKSLTIEKCSEFESFPNEGLAAPELETFYIRGLEKLKSMPKLMSTLLPSLNNLDICNCPRLELSEGCLPSNLKEMRLLNCSKLVASLKKGVYETNPSLKFLSIQKDYVECFPDEGLLPLSLTELNIKDCRNLKKLEYRGLCHLSFLQTMTLQNCPILQCLPEEGLPKSISQLRIEDCPLLKERCKKQGGEDWEQIAHIKTIWLDRKRLRKDCSH